MTTKIFVLAKPGAREEGVIKLSDNILKISVKEAPEAGRANLRIAEVLADFMKVPFGSVKLISGSASRKKLFEIDAA